MKTYCKSTKSAVLNSLIFIIALSCDDDEPKTLPVVRTGEVTDITTISAMGAGEIINDGNDKVLVSGLVFSSVNATPSIDDNKIELAVANGAFASEMTNLTSSTIYYVRAYATNGIGTGYGDVVNFTTGNAAPVATNISVTGIVQVQEKLIATYTYSDSENDVESGSIFQWYIANDGSGTGESAIEGATTLSYVIKETDEFKYIRIGITPKSSTGTPTGLEVKSSFVGPVAEEPIAVTFMYNGKSVTYGIIISPITGRRWLDRNLGAPNAPSASNDFANYGDLFQWGRGSDGHQLISRTATGATSVNGTTTTLSLTDSPGHGEYILTSAEPQDWRSPQNNDLWQGVNGINNPCPPGWRIPTIEEWQAENLTDLTVGYPQLKLTLGGRRAREDGSFLLTTSSGWYWSSTVATDSPIGVAKFQIRASGSPSYSTAERAIGASCRCIKD